MTDREYNFDDLDGCDYSEAVDNIAWRDRMRRESWIEEDHHSVNEFVG